MSVRKAAVTFVTLFSLMVGSMVGMAVLVGDEAGAARNISGYGVVTTP